MTQAKAESSAPGAVDGESVHDEGAGEAARYHRLRCLGRGGSGVVHEVFDRLRGRTIALKTLSLVTPQSLYLFKQEFRALAELRHANLVRLYELYTPENGAAYFTMELVEGRDFRQHTRVVAASQSHRPTQAELTVPELALVDAVGRPRYAHRARSRSTPAKLGELRAAMSQLVAGLRALHAAGKLHRDIKPPNVMVSTEGRVVILDFGLSAAILHREARDGAIAGTPEYMAPEQVRNEPLLPSADWYSVGTLLFDSLVGHLPFRGEPAEVMAQKLVTATLRPSDFVLGVPEDLDELCAQLLSREPGLRPTGKDVAKILEHGTKPRSSIPPSRSVAPPGIVCRTEELDRLLGSLASAAQGAPAAVFLHGASGAGKSTLVSQFVEHARRERGAATFAWRVYEQEAIPFKALDGLLDQLSQHFRVGQDCGSSWSAEPGRRALGQLFPVLRDLTEFRPIDKGRSSDPLRTRELAAEGLLSALRCLTKEGALVLVMDDAQWGDLDSAELLGRALSRVQALPLLLVFVHRPLGAEDGGFLRALRQGVAHLATRDIALGTLGAGDVRELLLGALGAESSVSDDLVATVLHHSSGNAFLAQELAYTLRDGSNLSEPTVGGAPASLDGLLLSQRLEGLEEEARRLLEIVSLSGKALPTETAAAAAGVDARVDGLVSSLSQRRLLRTAHDGELELVEVRHDRIRDWVVARLSDDERRDHHRRIAETLEALPDGEPDQWLQHWLAAGDTEQLRRASLAAAERAAERLALKRAESLYRTLLAQGRLAPRRAGQTYRALAEVLEWDGRGSEAAAAYLEAADLTTGIERSALQSAAGMLFIYAGDFAEGAQLLRASLVELGIHAPAGGLGALARLAIDRFRLSLLEHQLGQPPHRVPSEEGIAHVEVLHAAAFGFIFTDPLLGECFQVAHVVAAQKQGSVSQLARAVALEASQRAHRVPRRGQTDAETLFARAEDLARSVPDEALLEFIEACRGVSAFLCGQWSRAHERLRGAYQDVPKHRAGWHTNAWTYDVLALCNLGRFNEVGERVVELIATAEARRDNFSSSMLRVSAKVPFLLASGDPHAAREELVEGMKVWDRSRYLVQHWRAMWWSAETELYEGSGAAARQRCLRDERELEKSYLLRVQYIRGMTSFLRARIALATYREDERARLDEVQRWRRRLASVERPWTDALAVVVLGAEALARGALEDGAESLRRAIEACENVDMLAHAHACRLVLGDVLSGDEGEQLRRVGEAGLRERGVVEPHRFAAALIPRPR